MRYLLDTNVVSESRKRSPDGRVRAWLARAPENSLHLSVLVIGELRHGTERLRSTQPARAQALAEWVDSLAAAYRDRTFAVDLEVAEWWGRLNATHGPMPAVDGLLAATAKTHGLIVVTRNVKHFERVGVPVTNPWSDPSSA
jgi:predicted nucleic acid-binding protein